MIDIIKILENPKVHKLDNTKVRTYKRCPRLFFYEHVLGWRTDRPNINLEFGKALHLSLEYLYEQNIEYGIYTMEDLIEANKRFQTSFRTAFSLDDEISMKGHKNSATAYAILEQYISDFAATDAKNEFLYTEVSGAVPVSADNLLYFRLDTVYKDEQGRLCVLEHKTSGWSTELWKASMRLSTQIGCGNHVLYCMAEEADAVHGLVLNGIFIARNGAITFERHPMCMKEENLQAWLVETNDTINDIKQDLELLCDDCCASRKVMRSFQRNENACISYNTVCKFQDFCCAYSNPAVRISDEANPPCGFKQEHWDPTDEDEFYPKPHSLKIGVD